MEKTQFHKDIDAIVKAAINEDEEVVRACAGCEAEIGPMIAPPNSKSHSYCKRHFIEKMQQNLDLAQEMGNQELMASAQAQIQKAQARDDSTFPPDLSQHPELIDHAGREKYERDREATRRENAAWTQRFQTRV